MTKNASDLLQHDVISKIAKEKNKTTAQVLLRWATQRGLAVIPKTNNPDRLKQNADCTSFDLSDSELEAISSLNQGLRLNDPGDIDPRMAIFA